MRLMPISPAPTLGPAGPGAQDQGWRGASAALHGAPQKWLHPPNAEYRNSPSAHTLLGLPLHGPWALPPDPHKDPMKGAARTPL